jgi:hypothetical protein
MWEVEGRTTKEIAQAIGTSEKNVRHVVQRARASFVRVLSEWVVDEKSGATALDALSGTYKKASELAKKSSKVALSLLIVMVAFLGFNSITGSEFNTSNVIRTLVQETPTSPQTPPLVLRLLLSVALLGAALAPVSAAVLRLKASTTWAENISRSSRPLDWRNTPIGEAAGP